MLRRTGRFMVVLALCGAASIARAGIELVVLENPIHTRHLSGVVLDPSGAGIPGVLIAECAAMPVKAPEISEFGFLPREFEGTCGKADEHVVAWAISDSTGRFVVPKVMSGRTHKLLMSANGFNPMRMTVTTRPLASKELHITMSVAT